MKLFKQKKAGFIGAVVFGVLGFLIGSALGIVLGVTTDLGLFQSLGIFSFGGLLIGFFIGLFIPTLSIFLWGLTLFYVILPTDFLPGFFGDDLVVIAVRILIFFLAKV